jgi:hypothetical protein
MRVSAIVAACLVMSAAAHAGDIAGAGYGIISCARFSDAASLGSEVEDGFFAWAQGYMTGENTHRLGLGHPYRNLGSLTTEAQESFIKVYCAKHPEDRYMIAVMALMDAMPMSPAVKVSEGSR